MPEVELRSSISSVHGVGPAISQRLARLDIDRVFKLLFHYPKRYEDFSKITLIKECTVDDAVTLAVTVKSIQQRKAWKRRGLSIVEADVEDHTGIIKCVWFNQPYVANQLVPGTGIFLSGKVTKNKKYGIAINSPVFESVKAETTHTARIVPMYNLTHGISQKQIRYYIKQALELLQANPEELPEWIPETIQNEYNLIPLPQALQQIHFPDDNDDITAAQYRLGFNELLIIQLFVQSIKESVSKEQAPALVFNEEILQSNIGQLPFELTTAQKNSLNDIIEDTTLGHPMNRLLEGDVGAGKTVIAALAMQHVVENGYQATMMAPTALLAQQHYTSIQKILPNNIRIALLTGDRKDSIENADIIIGTHALIQDTVKFPKLGLAIIDEQHRFGVKQRKQLKDHSGTGSLTPHLLSMTATPIPRSLALTIYGDLSLSVLNELPAGRKPITTKLHKGSSTQLYTAVEDRLRTAEQVYIVAPRIEPDEEDKKMHSVEELLTEWEQQFPEYVVTLLHGKMKADEKQRIMHEFSKGAIHVLVSTTVIEVGVNVPNATCMIIYNAERFGLAQLHQLRGRVGRSNAQSYCYVLTESTQPDTQARLQLFTSTTDGFTLADYDLKTRGPGNVYGNSQSGFFNHFKMANIHDTELIEKTREAAEHILGKIEEYPLVERRLATFVKQLHLE